VEEEKPLHPHRASTLSGIRLLAVVVIGAAVVCSCQMRGARTAQSPFLKFLERGTGLICYLAPDGNIRLIDQKGGRGNALTTDAGKNGDGAVFYGSPTWSPDGKLIAFARVSLDSESNIADASLFTVRADGKSLAHLLSGTRLQPFYLFWSPDSRRVSLLSQIRGKAGWRWGSPRQGPKEIIAALTGDPRFTGTG
jgi:Tol biopolymer transport system component